MPKTHQHTVAECQQCGTCCGKGGPAFHLEDKPLIEKGVILSKYLFTIRKGEPAHENVKGGLTRVPTDIIKIKGKNHSWRCVFLDETDKRCTIYDNRPMECRVLKCWDTKDIEAIYLKDLLARKDLLSGIEGLWELVEDHQNRCDYESLETLLNSFKENNDNVTEDTVLEMIRYDAHLRDLIVKKGSMDKDMLPFLFGRPLVETIVMFGFFVQQDARRWRLRMKI